MITVNYAQRRLRFLFDTKSGSTPKSGVEAYWDGDINWITPEDLGKLEGREVYTTRRKISEEGYNNSGVSVVPAGSLVLSKRAPIGQTAILRVDATCNQGCFLLTPQEGVEERFYYYCLLAQRPAIEILGRGSTFMELSTDDFRSIHLPFPSQSEQLLIADYLDRETTQIDNLIAAKEQMLTLLEEKRAALINHIFTRGLDPNADLKPSGIAWLGKIPKSWEVRRGKYLFSQSSLPVRETDEIVTCFRDGQVTLRKNRREDGFTNAVLELGYQGIRKGQLILHSMDAFAGSIGISDSDGKCSPEYIICDPLFDGIDSQYYALLLRVMALRGFIQAACTAVRERAPRIRFSHLANMFLPLPPISEQQAIVQTIEKEKDSTKDLVIALTDSIALLKERRSALITAAVTGQIGLMLKSS